MSAADTGTLYQRLGGDAGIGKLIDQFYQRVTADPELAHFFATTNMDALRQMQREFFAAALGGPERYSGNSLAHAHAGRGIANRHFSRFVTHLLETLMANGAAPADVKSVVDRIATYAGDITVESVVPD